MSVEVGTVPKALIVLKVDELPILAFVKASNYADVAVDDTEMDKLYLEFGQVDSKLYVPLDQDEPESM